MPTAAQLQTMWDKQEIHDAILSHARGLDRFDSDLIASLYHEDGVDHRGDAPQTGREYAKFVFGPAQNGKYRLTRHHLTNILIDVQGDVARAETYFTGIHRFERDGREVELTQYGRYLDRFERRDGTWKIAKRWRVRDFARLDPVLEDPPPPVAWYMGKRSTADAVYTIWSGMAELSERPSGIPRAASDVR